MSRCGNDIGVSIVTSHLLFRMNWNLFFTHWHTLTCLSENICSWMKTSRETIVGTRARVRHGFYSLTFLAYSRLFMPVMLLTDLSGRFHLHLVKPNLWKTDKHIDEWPLEPAIGTAFASWWPFLAENGERFWNVKRSWMKNVWRLKERTTLLEFYGMQVHGSRRLLGEWLLSFWGFHQVGKVSGHTGRNEHSSTAQSKAVCQNIV